jgi:hypothetical protein
MCLVLKTERREDREGSLVGVGRSGAGLTGREAGPSIACRTPGLNRCFPFSRDQSESDSHCQIWICAEKFASFSLPWDDALPGCDRELQKRGCRAERVRDGC